LELQHDAQRGRDFGDVLLAFGHALEQSGKVPPDELAPVFDGQTACERRRV